MAREKLTMDGNTAAAHVSYAFTDVATIYPITPSSNMAEAVDKWAADGLKNIFGQTVQVTEMQSEAGAAGAVHGSLAAGALTTTYTASQGLLLMIPNMYKIAGELLPSVIHVSARALATHALSIFGDHSDVYACRQTGYSMLASSSVQEVMDLGAVAHLATIKGRVPVLHFFDGFRTSHEIDKIEVWDFADLEEMLDKDAVNRFRKNALNPEHPVQRGTAQNPDIFFQAKEASNKFYDAFPAIVEEYMDKVNAKIGTDYKLFNYYGAPDAEHVIIAMGSVTETVKETIDYLAAKGQKVGLVTVRLYRPLVAAKLIEAIPASAKSISVLDRAKEPGSIGEPLYLDVVLALRGSKFDQTPIYAGRYGLGSKDTIPANIISVYENAKTGKTPRFTIGIEDDVTHLSLPIGENPDTSPEGTTSCKFWGLGSDGTVGANKNSIKIIGDHTDMYAQAYFDYDSKKSGGITKSHLRFGKKPIRSTYLVSKANFVACHNPSYIDKYDMVSDLIPGGTFLLNCAWDDAELDQRLPGDVKSYIAKNNIKFYIIDAIDIARKIGLGNRTNTVLQSAFFKLANIIPEADGIEYMKKAAYKSYSKRGDKVVNQNYEAIDQGATGAREVKVPDSWKTASGSVTTKKAEGSDKLLTDYIDNILTPVNAQLGDKLPVSAFAGREDGTVPLGSSAYEKRGIAVDVPCWKTENCIQCNFCAYVCPHAVIRPVILSADEAAKAPAGTKLIDATGLSGYKFAMTVSVQDCTGCGSCANVCPGKQGNKALVLEPLDTQLEQQEIFAYALDLPEKKEVSDKFKESTVKGSQFKLPYLEFSGACAGCGETPYAKLVTQLFGERMYIANATGCSSIWGGSAPSTPYTKNKLGRGPSWANSLFEDNAEYGLGMYLGQKSIRDRLIRLTNELIAVDWAQAGIKEAGQKWLDTLYNSAENTPATEAFIAALEDGIDLTGTEWEGKDCDCDACSRAKAILKDKEFLAKKSIWIFGGDGWAYDIGFGGLDHVIASGEDVNILVFDTEVYSNTGGQSSKSTPTGAIAQFAAAGKEVKKKDLAAIAMSYGYVYVAQIGQGADYNQCIKAFTEAESYHGPSIVIAYAPCINHGISIGMGKSQTQIKNAVAAGYWHLFRFDPRLTVEGKNPFQLDSKAPSTSYKEFIGGESRYSSLQRFYPDRADRLFDRAELVAKEKYEHLIRLSKLYEA
ncbi:pyruvate-flavodoxin oxidoreductase [Clostridia bacterium]|nr:pyruvate-flavodoxin oxidoreductase [Clostridia bacterium]